MKLLLDTHIWIWSSLLPERLSRKTSAALADPGNELWVSPISTWEIALLCSKGRLTLEGGATAWIHQALSQSPLREAPLTHEIALASANVEIPSRDPADRFLAATARVLGLTLVTADRAFTEARNVQVMLNT